MKGRKLGDAMFFFEEMKRRGLQPDVRAMRLCMVACLQQLASQLLVLRQPISYAVVPGWRQQSVAGQQSSQQHSISTVLW
jgi:pentatricopeptide repeat protein